MTRPSKPHHQTNGQVRRRRLEILHGILRQERKQARRRQAGVFRQPGRCHQTTGPACRDRFRFRKAAS